MKKDFLLVSLGLGTSAVLGFVFTVLMARSLTPADFGIYSALISLVAITFSLGDLGVGPAIINFLPKHKDQTKPIIDTTYWFQYLVALLIMIMFWLGARFSHLIIPGSGVQQMVLVGSLAFNYILIGFAQSVFTAEKKFWSFSLSQIIDSVIKVMLVLVLYYFGKLSITNALIANFVSVTFTLVFTFWSQLLDIDLLFKKNVFQQIFQYSKWIAVSRLFSIFISRIDLIMLNLLASSFQAGIFAAATRIALIFALIVSSVGTVINPRFSAIKSKDSLIKFITKLAFLVSIVSAIVLVTAIFSSKIVHFVYGDSYADAARVYSLLAISMIPFLYTVITSGVLLYTFKQAKFYATTAMVQVLIIVSINLALIPSLGYFAPVLATALSNVYFLGHSIIKTKELFDGTSFPSPTNNT